MLDQKTKRKIDSARDILVGKVPDPKAQVEQITTALIYKFMDDMDKEAQELGGKPRFFTNGYKKFAWTKLMDPKLGGHDRLDLYVEAITSISQNPNIPQLFRDIFNDAFLPYRNPETLGLFLKEINGFAYDNSEDLGNAYEYLLSILGSQGDAGQFRTPRHIIDFIVSAVDPKKDETVCDPACGTAGFLISAYKHILKQHDGIDDIDNKEKPLTPDERKTLMEHFAGYDISPDMVRISKVNLYLHGFPSPTIFEYDTLSSEEKWDESFDVMLANPPFMTPKGGIRPHKRFSVQSNRSEVLFVDYILEHLRPSGRAGIIVPEGIIFQSGKAYKALRKMLIEDGLLAVVSLPAGVFNPYSGVKTSILLFDNTLAKKTKDILFLKIVNDGYDLGAQRRKHDKNDLPLALTIIKKYKLSLEEGKDFELDESEKLIAHFVVKEKIAEDGDYNLSGDRYIEVVSFANQKWPIEKIADLIDSITPPVKIQKSAFGLDGKYPIIDQSQEVISGWTDDESALVRSNKPLVIFGDHTCAIKYLEQPFAQGADGIKILNTHDELLPKYLYFYLRSKPVESNGYKRHFSKLKETKIPLPPLEVQKEIVEQIEKYQKIVDGARQVVENYKPRIEIYPNWNISLLPKLVKIKTGTLNANAADVNGDYPFFTCSKDIYKINTYSFDCEALLLAGNNATADYDVKYFKGKFDAYQRTYVITIKDINVILYGYLKVILENKLPELKSKSIGNLTKYLTIKILNALEIPVPPIDTQNKIVKNIKEEQLIIEANKKLIEIYEQKIADVLNEI